MKVPKRKPAGRVLLWLFGSVILIPCILINFIDALLPREIDNHRVQNQNKTLVVILGNLRGGEIAWRTLYNNVLDVNSADLALMIGEIPEENRTSSLFSRAKYTWLFKEYDNWADAIDLINGTSWRETILPYVNRRKGLFGGVDDIRGSGAVIFMVRWFLANRIRNLNLTRTYDRFIITRSDHFYGCAHDVSELERGKLWLPEGQDYGGFTDRHLVADSSHVLDAINILPPLLQSDSHVVAGHTSNPEYIIKYIWTHVHGLTSSVRHFDRPMFTCAVRDDQTRWKNAQDPVPGVEGLFKKYTGEFNSTILNCARRFNPSVPTYSTSSRRDRTLELYINKHQLSVIRSATNNHV